MNDLKSKLWPVLKKHGIVTLDTIVSEIGTKYTKKEISICLDALIKKGYVEKTGEFYKIKFVLDKAPKKQAPERFFQYERICGVAPYPAKYMNPLESKLAHRDQDGRGTCVGQSGAYTRDLDFMRITKDLPTSDEISRFERDLATNVGACILFHDRLYDNHSFSAECIYRTSRRLGHVTDPEGSYVESAVDGMLKEGACFENEWYTSKQPTCAPEIPYPWDTKNEIPGKMALHKIEGYAQGNTFEAAKLAIYTHGYIYMAIPIYENYAEHGTDGIFPDPAGNEIGGHALCFIGYDEDNLYCIHSWGAAWSRIGGISRKYFDRAECQYLVILDENETREAQKIYKKVKITVNTGCTVNVLSMDQVVMKELSVQLEVGQEYSILAEPINQVNWQPSQQVKFVKVTNTTDTVDFVFTYIDTRSWIRKFLDAIFSFFANIATPLQYSR